MPEITIRGITAPNATRDGHQPPGEPDGEADEDGNFEVTVGLLPGSNVIEIEALDPVTGRDSGAGVSHGRRRHRCRREPVAGGRLLVLTQPAADATVHRPGRPGRDGRAGIGAPGHRRARRSQAIPTFTITDPAGTPLSIRPPTPPAPDPLALTADDSGRLQLAS